MDNVKIRPFKIEDTYDLHAIWQNPLVGRTTLQLPSLELEKVAERLTNAGPELHRFVAEVNGRAVGLISLHPHYPNRPRMAHCMGLGMMVHPDYWGQGIGSALMAAMLDLADNWLNLKRVELEVNTDNPAAIRLYQKFGFVIEGTKRFHTYGDGRWADSHFMGRVRD